MMDLGIALLPNEEVRELNIQMNKELQAMHRTSYSLGEVFHPHLSLYQSTFKSYGDLQSAMQGLGDLESYVARVEVRLRNLKVHPSNFVTFQCYPTEGLQKLHTVVLKIASQARLKDAPSIWERNNVLFDAEKEENIRRYGYPDAFEFYDPHFTIGRILDRDVDKEQIISGLMKAASKYIDYAFRPEEIAIYELGVDGGCLNPRKLG